MFTGIIEQLGRVAAIQPSEAGMRLTIDARGWAGAVRHGESIAVNGCCLTVTSAAAQDERSGPGRPEPVVQSLRFDVIRQTMGLTTLGGLRTGDAVNLERAATPTTLLGGHFVQGHVDGVARVVDARRDPEEARLRIEPPSQLMEFIVERGSVAVDGVSLTVAAADESAFEVALIPTTLQLTTLGNAAVGSRLNIETDYLVRAVIGWMRRQQTPAVL